MPQPVEEVKLRIETCRKGDMFVGTIHEVTTNSPLARKEGKTLTFLSRELRGTGYVPTSLQIVRNMCQEYVIHRHGGVHAQ